MVAHFKSLVKMIRFHHISSDYLANVVTCCPLAIASGLIPSFLRSALFCRDANKRVAEVCEVDLGAGMRVKACEEWKFSTTFLLVDLMKVEKGGQLWKVVGLAGGYPVRVCLQQEKENFAAFVRPLMPCLAVEPEECLGRHVGFSYKMQVGSIERSLERLFSADQGWGWPNLFVGRSWDKVVCENSEDFNDKKELEVVLTRKKLEKED